MQDLGLTRAPEDPQQFTWSWRSLASSQTVQQLQIPTQDRQIGDRRGQNFREGKVEGGPSHSLPTASALLGIGPKRYTEALVGSIADRRDFYHQFAVTDERSFTNGVYPPLNLEDLEGTQASLAYKETLRRGRRIHLGVEFAADAHGTMLAEYGLIEERSRLQGKLPIIDDAVSTGLVIDDFFVISKETCRADEDYTMT